jgi:hypothetical protein
LEKIKLWKNFGKKFGGRRKNTLHIKKKKNLPIKGATALNSALDFSPGMQS